MTDDQKLEAEARVRAALLNSPCGVAKLIYSGDNIRRIDLADVLSDLTSARARIAELEAGLADIAAQDGPITGTMIGPLYMAGLSAGLKHGADRARALLKDGEHG